MAVDVVIVNWNSGKQLRACVDSVRAFGDGLVGSVTVVDNGSTDGSLELGEAVETVNIIRAGKNLGFAAACNRGAAEVSAEYVLFLNPDARLMEGTLEKVVGFMGETASATIGICGVRLLGGMGQIHRHCARFPTWKTYCWHCLGLSVLWPKVFPSLFMQDFDHKTSRKVDHVIGAFYFVRRRVFTDLEGFDQRFFVYLEDLDFSRRAADVGWKAWYLGEATAFHKGGGTSEQVKVQRLFYSLRSRLLYVFKHFSRPQAWVVTALTLGAEPLTRVARALARGSSGEARDVLQGYRMLWADLRNILHVAHRG